MNNAQLLIDEVKKAVKGKDDCIIKAFAAFLAGGHILLEVCREWERLRLQ